MERLNALERTGLRACAIFLTHHHLDHVGGVAPLVARLGLPVWCHPRTADRLDVKVARVLADGEVVTLEGAPDMHWRVLHTPGHARGHLCLVDEASRAAVVGDMVAHGHHPHRPARRGHGGVPAPAAPAEGLAGARATRPTDRRFPDGPTALERYLAHREARELRVKAALREAPQSLEELAQEAYADTPTAWPPVAERSTLAILLELAGEAEARRVGERWARA